MTKVWETLWPDFKTAAFWNQLSTLATTCGTLSRLVQVTVARGGSVKLFGEELKLAIATSVFIGLTGADALVSESLPCVLLKSATATNIANARVPVFKCFRSGQSTDTRLVVCF